MAFEHCLMRSDSRKMTSGTIAEGSSYWLPVCDVPAGELVRSEQLSAMFWKCKNAWFCLKTLP